MATATMANRAEIRWPAVLDPLPVALLALAPLALGPPTTGRGLGDLLLGLVPLLALERNLPAVGAAILSARRPQPAHVAVVALALAAAALLRPGLVPIALLFAGCLLVRACARSGMLAVVATALAAGLAVEAGALLLGGERDLLPPAAVGALVWLEGSVRLARTDHRSSGTDPGRLALARLTAFCLALALVLALATGRDLLGAEPNVWMVSALPLLAIALLVRVAAPERARRAESSSGVGERTMSARLRSLFDAIRVQPWRRCLGHVHRAAIGRALRSARAKPAFDAPDPS